MIELENALLFDGNTKINKTYDQGVFYFEKDESFIYSFLTLRYQNLLEGRFTIDGTDIFPFSDTTKSLYILALKTKTFVGRAYFVLDKTMKVERVKEIKAKVNDAKNKPNKALKDILGLFISLQPNYACIDLNNKKNNKISDKITSLLSSLSFSFPIFVYKKNEKIVPLPEKNNQSELKANSQDNTPMTLSKYIKKNGLIFFALFILETFAVLTALLIPYFMKKDNKSSVVIQIVGLSLTFIFFLTIMVLSYFVMGKKKKGTLGKQVLCNFVVLLISVGMGIALFYLLKYGFDFKDYKFKEANLGVITIAVLVGCNILFPLIKKIVRK